jgi:hypothetical protein
MILSWWTDGKIIESLKYLRNCATVKKYGMLVLFLVKVYHDLQTLFFAPLKKLCLMVDLPRSAET